MAVSSSFKSEIGSKWKPKWGEVQDSAPAHAVKRDIVYKFASPNEAVEADGPIRSLLARLERSFRYVEFESLDGIERAAVFA
jgi:hypothetical protein